MFGSDCQPMYVIIFYYSLNQVNYLSHRLLLISCLCCKYVATGISWFMKARKISCGIFLRVIEFAEKFAGSCSSLIDKQMLLCATKCKIVPNSTSATNTN